mmetsp:Transcript_24210/g.76150  ORF Transcript_24210/g.76150 Transcript_24210/m.76150 type:complete len:210 (-) Transcript_24210:3076-3705(-)
MPTSLPAPRRYTSLSWMAAGSSGPGSISTSASSVPPMRYSSRWRSSRSWTHRTLMKVFSELMRRLRIWVTMMILMTSRGEGKVSWNRRVTRVYTFTPNLNTGIRLRPRNVESPASLALLMSRLRRRWALSTAAFRFPLSALLLRAMSGSPVLESTGIRSASTALASALCLASPPTRSCFSWSSPSSDSEGRDFDLRSSIFLVTKSSGWI